MDRRRSRRSAAAAPTLGVFAVAALAFARALANGFVWDDKPLIAQTFGFRALDLRHLRWMFTTRHLDNFCPLAWLSYGLDYKLWGLNPAGFHLTNILLHAAAASLLFLLARRLLRLSLGGDERSLTLAAAFAALVFALHPLRVESVAWASERRDVLAGVFFIGTLLLYVEGRRAASIACYALAALSKATVVPLPVVLVILDLYPLRRRLGRAQLVEKWPYAAIAAACAAAALRAQALGGNLASLHAVSLGQRLSHIAISLGFYLSKTAWPSRLAPLYPLPDASSLFSSALLGALAALAATELALRLCRVPGAARAALWAYYLVMLLPVSGLVQNGFQLVASRYSYLSCLAWAVSAGAAMAWLLRAARDGRRAPAAAGAVLLGGALVVLAAVTQQQLVVWHDNVTLWSEEMRLYPGSLVGRLNLAKALLDEGRFAAAAELARAALRQDPTSRLARYDLADSLVQQGRLPEAQSVLDELVKAEPDCGPGLGLAGWAQLAQGHGEVAGPLLRRAAVLDPAIAQDQFLWGSWLASRGRLEEALPYLTAATRLAPEEAAYRQALAKARASSR